MPITQMRISRCRKVRPLADDHAAGSQWGCAWTPHLACSFQSLRSDPTADRPPGCPHTDPSHLQGVALGLGPGPPSPKPPHTQLHLGLGDLELHSVPLQPCGQCGLPALQRSRQGPQQGCPSPWRLAHPAAGGQCTSGSASWSRLFPGAPPLSAAPTPGVQAPQPILLGRGVRGQTHIPSALGGPRLPPLMPHDPWALPCDPLTQGQPGGQPPQHRGCPWLRPQPRSHGDCRGNPGWAWSSGPQEPGNGPPRKAHRGVLGWSKVTREAGSWGQGCSEPMASHWMNHPSSHEPLGDPESLAPGVSGRADFHLTELRLSSGVGVKASDPECNPQQAPRWL